MLEVQNLSVTARNGTQLLKQISFQIEIGEAVGLTGQSGAGKTTLLKALLGILGGGCQVGGPPPRAAAACRTALHPQHILADEPTSALDAETRTLLLELLEKQRETAGILFISHDVAALRALCGTVYVMEHGMLTEQGTMQELLEHPKQAWTKEYAAANRPASREGWTWTD